MNAIIDMQKDNEDFINNVVPFIRRVHVCQNSNTKLLEHEDGTLEEYKERKKDAWCEY